MAKIIILVGPPGSGKTTYANNWLNDQSEESFKYKRIRINQDEQGKDHLKYFQNALDSGQYEILIDRMNFNKQQRERYLKPALKVGYTTEIVVLHESKETCIQRMANRADHPTIKTEQDASSALNTFFKLYERPTKDEADVITFKYPEGPKEKVIVCDLDGTLCNTQHREHLVKHVVLDDEKVQKKNWPLFFKELKNDTPNEWCKEILSKFQYTYDIVFCSGRPDDYKKDTEEWLKKNSINYNYLFMRQRGDYRKDDIVKENILDFEILSRYEPYFVIDDRLSVCQMWRRRGLVCLQCAPGEF